MSTHAPERTVAAQRAEHALEQLWPLVDAVRALPDGKLLRGRYTSDRVSGRSHDAPPSPSPSWDAVDVLRGWASEWVDAVAAVLDHPERRVATWQPTWAQGLAYLQQHLQWLLASPLGARFVDDVVAQADRMRVLAGLEVHRVRLVVPCPRCDRHTLARTDGTDVIECAPLAGCGATWTKRDFDRIVAALARAAIARRREERAARRRRAAARTEPQESPC